MILENSSQRGPITFLTVVLSATCAVLIFFGWSVWKSYEENKIIREQISQIEKLRGIIIHFDEVLTMSARIAAATGDLRWEKRYRSFEPKLDAAIKKAIELEPTAYSGEAAAQTDAANIKLVAMENRGFDLIHQGRVDDAKILLFSDEYEKQKRIYTQGMINLDADLSGLASMILQKQQRQTLLTVVSVLLLIPLLIIVWIVAFSIIRGWAKTLISKKVLEKEIVARKQAEEQIKASLKEKEVLLAEVYHRVKNNMQVIISLLRLQAKKIEDKKHADIFIENENRIRSMALIHEQLYQSKDLANINFREYIKTLSKELFTSHRADPDKIKLNLEIEDVSFDLATAIPCGLITNELISNSLKYAFSQKDRTGQIKLWKPPDSDKRLPMTISIDLLTINEDEFELKVSDNGVGIPADLDIRNADTMGLSLVRALAEHQLDGKIDLDRTAGTQFKIKFKRAVYKPRI